MRILEAFGEPVSYGGQESFVINALDNMDRNGLNVDFLSPYYCDNENIRSKVRQYGGEVYTLGCAFRPGRSRNNAVSPVRSFLNEHYYDVIHIHSGSNSMLALFARLASEAGIPRIIVHSHCTGKHGLKHFVSKAVTSYSLRKYPTVYCACSREAGEWRFPPDVCRSYLRIINNGIDVEQFRYDERIREKMRSSLCLDGDTVLAGCVGRLTYQKNQLFLLDVMKLVKNRKTTEFYKLILVGEGEDRHALEERARILGITEDVIFTGAVDNVRDYMQAVDIAVMPSRYEGLAIAAIEAQAAGLEVIASDTIPEAAACTEGMTFLPADDEEQWADAIMKQHARHPEQADVVRDSGFSIEETARIVRKLYYTNK